MDNLLFGLEYALVFLAIPILLIVAAFIGFAALAEKMNWSASTVWALLLILIVSLLRVPLA